MMSFSIPSISMLRPTILLKLGTGTAAEMHDIITALCQFSSIDFRRAQNDFWSMFKETWSSYSNHFDCDQDRKGKSYNCRIAFPRKANNPINSGYKRRNVIHAQAGMTRLK